MQEEWLNRARCRTLRTPVRKNFDQRFAILTCYATDQDLDMSVLMLCTRSGEYGRARSRIAILGKSEVKIVFVLGADWRRDPICRTRYIYRYCAMRSSSNRPALRGVPCVSDVILLRSYYLPASNDISIISMGMISCRSLFLP